MEGNEEGNMPRDCPMADDGPFSATRRSFHASKDCGNAPVSYTRDDYGFTEPASPFSRELPVGRKYGTEFEKKLLSEAFQFLALLR